MRSRDRGVARIAGAQLSDKEGFTLGLPPQRLVLSKAIEALLMKLRIGNRAALLAHTGLAECRVSL